MSERAPHPLVAHITPFVVWVAMMHFLDVPQIHPAWRYAAQTATGAVLLYALKPWRWYPALRAHNVPTALLAGVGVFLLWVLPESPLAPAGLRDIYQRWLVLPFGELRNPIEAAPYAPSYCGWPLTLIRAAGCGLVIPVIEEVFWRGFIQRWVMGGEFWRNDAAAVDGLRFLVVAVIFGAEHQEWLAGVVAGLAYGALYVRTRDLWAVALAHAVTNSLLSFYVIRTGSWLFW